MPDNSLNKAPRGSISKVILMALSSGERYGYEICKKIEKLSDGKVVLKQPSLYSSLRRMEKQGLILSHWEESDIGGRRHCYTLTDLGKEICEKNKDNFKDLKSSLPSLNPEPKVVVASQQNIFNLLKDKNKTEKIMEDEEDSENKSFVQFDMFNQNVDMIKSTPRREIKEIKEFSNKYENLDNSDKNIEPEPPKPKETKETKEKLPKIFNEKTINRKDVFPSMTEKAKPRTSKQKISWNEEAKDDEIFDSSDYKTVIGQLYKDFKLDNPYEQNKFQNFKEIFPSAKFVEPEQKQDETEMSSYIEESKQNKDDLIALKKQYERQGIRIREHIAKNNKNTIKNYTDINRLNMATAIITSVIMLIELFICFMTTKNIYPMTRNVHISYVLYTALTFLIALSFVLRNLFDRFKLVIIKPNFKRNFGVRMLVFMFTVIFIFVIYLISLNARNLLEAQYFNYWFVPVILSTNIVISYVIYFLLLRSKKFNR